MRRFTISLLVLGLLCTSFTAYALEWTYEDAIGFIDAMNIDGTKIFTDFEKGYLQMNEDEIEQHWWYPRGMLFEYFYGYKQGLDVITSNTDYKNYKNTRECINSVFESAYFLPMIKVCGTFIDQYIDYESGARVTVCFSLEPGEDPMIQLEYSPIKRDNVGHAILTSHAFETYDNFNEFYGAATYWSYGGGKLEKGSKGEEVKLLQTGLNELGYSVGKADGSYGNATASAVSEFQRINNLDQTGVADKQTLIKLFSGEAFPAGTSTVEEINAVASSVASSLDDNTREELASVLAAADKDGDGTLSFEEIFGSNY